MQTRSLGSLDVSLVGLGCNNFGMRVDEAQTAAVVHAALDAGITLFDTADVYGATKSEEFLGRALGPRRDEVVLATKWGMGDGETLPAGAGAAAITTAIEGSLRRLGTDRIDLFQLHRPDDTTPIDETLEALHGLVEAGKVIEVGCSNFSGDLIDAAEAAAGAEGRARFVSVQNHLNLLNRRDEADLLASCDRNGLSILPYFPLASGMLTGKYTRGAEPPEGTRLSMVPAERRERALSDAAFDKVEALDAFAKERGHTLLELAFSWLAGLPHMGSVIAGATKPEQVTANVAAVGWELTADERAAVDAITLATGPAST